MGWCTKASLRSEAGQYPLVGASVGETRKKPGRAVERRAVDRKVTHDYHLRSHRSSTIINTQYNSTRIPADVRSTEGSYMFFQVPTVENLVRYEIKGHEFTPGTLPDRFNTGVIGNKTGLIISPVLEQDNNIKVKAYWLNINVETNTIEKVSTRTATGKVYSAFTRPPPVDAQYCTAPSLYTEYLNKQQVGKWRKNPGKAHSYKSWLGAEYYDHAIYLNNQTGTAPLNRYLEGNPQGRVIVVCDDTYGAVPMDEALVVDQGGRVHMVGWRFSEQDGGSGSGSGSSTGELRGGEPSSLNGSDLNKYVSTVLSQDDLSESALSENTPQEYSKAGLSVSPELMREGSAIFCTGGSRCTLENFNITSPEGSDIPDSVNNLFLRASRSSGQMLNNQFSLPENVTLARGDGESMLFKGNEVLTGHKLVMKKIYGNCHMHVGCNGVEPCLVNSPECSAKASYCRTGAVNQLQCIQPSPPANLPAPSTTIGTAVGGATVTKILCSSYGALCPLPSATATMIVPQVSNIAAIATVGALAGGALLLALEETVRYQFGWGPTLIHLCNNLMGPCHLYCQRGRGSSTRMKYDSEFKSPIHGAGQQPCVVQMESVKVDPSEGKAAEVVEN